MNSIRRTYLDILGDYTNDNPIFYKCIIAKILNPGFNVLCHYRAGSVSIRENSIVNMNTIPNSVALEILFRIIKKIK